MKSIPRLLLVCLLALVFCAHAAAGESLSLPEGLQEIGEEAFADCESLSGVLVIPQSVRVDGSAFSNTPDLTVIRGVAVVGDESTPWNGTLDWDVKTAVSAFCQEWNIDFLYTTDAAGALSSGYNVIVTVGFMATDAVNDLQTQYPGARFICLDGGVENQQDNVYCVLYNTEQSGFMAGYAAVRMGYRSLGFLGGIQEVYDVVKYGDGFILGANQAAVELGIEDKVTVARAYTGTFGPDPEVYQKAASWYDKGVEIIFCCGGDMCQPAVQAAKDKNGLMIGVDTDQSSLGSAVVTSAMKNLGFSAADALTALLNGGWDSLGGACVRLGVISGVPAENHVCLAPGTQFNGGFTTIDYTAMVASLYSGAYPSGELLITVTPEPYVPRVAVAGDEAEPETGTLDREVQTAVSAFCRERNIDFLYTNDAEAALQAGYDVIVTVGFMASDAVGGLQTRYPGARFICLDSEVDDQQDNVYCVRYDTEQSGFMAGYAAVRMGYRSLGFLGGIPVPDVVSFGDGFVLGANQAAAELGITDQVTVVRTYTGTFAPDPGVYQKAAAWYDEGVEVIFCCGGSMCHSAIEAADEKNGLMIGVDSDQRNLGPAVVTSAMKNMGFSATDALTRILDRGWSSLGGESVRLGVISTDPAQNHVCLAPLTQFNGGFTSVDYRAMVASLYRGTYPSGELLITVAEEQEEEEPVIVSTAADLLALGGTLTGTVVVIPADNDPVDLTWPVTLEGELRVETGDNQFSSLRICEGGSLTLAEGSLVQTLSSWDPVSNQPFAVAQVWVNGGVLDASLGTVEDYSTVYITGGSVLLAEGADGVYLIGGATNEASLRAFLSDSRMDEFFLEADMTLTDDVALTRNTQIHPQVTVTVPHGVTLTVCSGCTLNVTDDGSALIIASGGQLIVEDGGEVHGNVQREQNP